MKIRLTLKDLPFLTTHFTGQVIKGCGCKKFWGWRKALHNSQDSALKTTGQRQATIDSTTVVQAQDLTQTNLAAVKCV